MKNLSNIQEYDVGHKICSFEHMLAKINFEFVKESKFLLFTRVKKYEDWLTPWTIFNFQNKLEFEFFFIQKYISQA